MNIRIGKWNKNEYNSGAPVPSTFIQPKQPSTNQYHYIITKKRGKSLWRGANNGKLERKLGVPWQRYSREKINTGFVSKFKLRTAGLLLTGFYNLEFVHNFVLTCTDTWLFSWFGVCWKMRSFYVQKKHTRLQTPTYHNKLLCACSVWLFRNLSPSTFELSDNVHDLWINSIFFGTVSVIYDI